MADKKKQPPIPAPKAPPKPLQQQAPPATTPAPGQAGGETTGAPAPRDHSEVPVESKDKPEHKASPDVPDLSITKSTVTVPFDPIDWSSMMKPMRLRGVPLTTRDYDSVEQYWGRTYKSLMNLGLTADLAIDITNAALPTAIDLSLSRDFPTTTERLERETERMLGPGKSLGTKIIPLNFGIEWAVSKATGKKFKLEF